MVSSPRVQLARQTYRSDPPLLSLQHPARGFIRRCDHTKIDGGVLDVASDRCKQTAQSHTGVPRRERFRNWAIVF